MFILFVFSFSCGNSKEASEQGDSGSKKHWLDSYFAGLKLTKKYGEAAIYDTYRSAFPSPQCTTDTIKVYEPILLKMIRCHSTEKEYFLAQKLSLSLINERKRLLLDDEHTENNLYPLLFCLTVLEADAEEEIVFSPLLGKARSGDMLFKLVLRSKEIAFDYFDYTQQIYLFKKILRKKELLKIIFSTQKNILKINLLNKVGDLLYAIGDYEKAVLFQEQALDITVAKYGEGSIYTVVPILNLGSVKAKIGEIDDAYVLFKSAISILREKPNENTDSFRYALASLSGILRKKGLLGDADKMIKEAFVLGKGKSGSILVESFCLYQKAELLSCMPNRGTPVDLYEKVISNLKSLGKSGEIQLGRVYYSESLYFWNAGCIDEAFASLRRAISCSEKINPNHSDAIKYQETLNSWENQLLPMQKTIPNKIGEKAFSEK